MLNESGHQVYFLSELLQILSCEASQKDCHLIFDEIKKQVMHSKHSSDICNRN